MSKQIETDANTCCQWLSTTHHMRSKRLSISHRPCNTGLCSPSCGTSYSLNPAFQHLAFHCSHHSPEDTVQIHSSPLPHPHSSLGGLCPLALQDDSSPFRAELQAPVQYSAPMRQSHSLHLWRSQCRCEKV